MSYVPGYLEEGKDIADFTAEDLDKMLRGETVEGIRLPKLTLNGASFKQLAVGNWGDDLMTQQLNLHLQLELVGDSSIAYDETYLAEGAVYSKNVWALYITGNGKLNVTAPAENGWGLFGDWGLYRQESSTVTIQAGECGIGYDTWSSFSLMFHGGKLTIEAGNDPKDYGVINSWNEISFDISESTTFLLGDSAENCISLTAPYTIDSVRQELTDAYDEGKLTHNPFYLSLTANYTVTFDTDGGSAVDSQPVAYGGQAAAPAAPAKTGYTFAGWYLEGEKFNFNTPVTKDMTLTARWTANQYTITFDTDGGSAIEPITQDYGTAITAPADPNNLTLKGRVQGDVWRLALERPDLLTPSNGGEVPVAVNWWFGPKDRTMLATAPDHLSQAVNFGMFSIIARPLLTILAFFHSFVGNWGIAILMLTFCIRVVFWPLSQKSFKSMEQMKKLQPMMKKLREKHKDDKEALNKEMMQLYKTYKVNPAGGCLPIVVQIPVFIGLYQALLNSIELRHASFIEYLPFTHITWLADLSAADPFYITPLLMGASMFLQQRLTPAAGDPTQQKVMMFMPVIFTVMFINFPAGLVIYWLCNNILSIGQQWWMLRKA